MTDFIEVKEKLYQVYRNNKPNEDNYDNCTLALNIKELFKNNYVNEFSYNKITQQGIYVFNIIFTVGAYPKLPINYMFTLVYDDKPYIIVNYSTITKMHYLNSDINDVLTNINDNKLFTIFRPDIDEQYLFENLLNINDLSYDYYSI